MSLHTSSWLSTLNQSRRKLHHHKDLLQASYLVSFANHGFMECFPTPPELSRSGSGMHIFVFNFLEERRISISLDAHVVKSGARWSQTGFNVRKAPVEISDFLDLVA